MYGHCPTSINIYVPLTHIGGSNALFLEKTFGDENWHPVTGEYGVVKRFAGAMNAHWTTENKTSTTRVSLDFRIILGEEMFSGLKCGGSVKGGAIDVYRRDPGYYKACNIVESTASSTDVTDTFVQPDARVGFPWTQLKKFL